MISLSPSVLSADFANLEQDIRAVEAAGADMLHLDVMDGHFVPNISFGMPVIAAIRRSTGLFLDVHIMISEPQRYLEDLARAGADGITFHVEAQGDPAETIRRIRELGLRPGLALSPDTPAEAVLPYLDKLDLLLVMTVVPGFGGQKFRGDMCPKIEAVSARVRELGRENLTIQVDGGIGRDTAPLCVRAGARCLVAGSAIFGKADYKAEMEAIRAACAGADT